MLIDLQISDLAVCFTHPTLANNMGERRALAPRLSEQPADTGRSPLLLLDGLRHGAKQVAPFAVVLCVVAVFGSRAACGAGTEFQMRGDDLVVNVDARWAGNSQGGYYPIRIRLVNRGPARNLTFRFASPGVSEQLPTVRRTIGAEQNATVQFTLSVPMAGHGTYGFLSVSDARGPLKSLGSRQISLPEFERGSFDRPALLVISPNVVDCQRFEDAVNSMGAAVAGGGGRSYGRAVSGSSRTTDHQVIPPLMLPDSWLDYSGLDIVAVPLYVLAGLSRQNRSAILGWVHQGGTLIVYDVREPAPQSRKLSRLLEFDRHACISPAWEPAKPGQRRAVNVIKTDEQGNVIVEPQLAVAPAGMIEATAPGMVKPGQAPPAAKPEFVWAGRPDTFARRKLMQGYVYAFKENPFPGSAHDWDWFLRSLGQERYQWTARNGISARRESGEFLHFLIPSVKGVPVLAFIVLITLFTAVIGPLNYFVLWKRKQLYLLVVSIPVIALVTSLSLFGYSAVAHGFGTKSRVRSFTVLDQKSKTAVTTARIALYAGLAPSHGLRFSPETAVYTIWPMSQTFESGDVDWTETQALESGWLRSRTRTQFLTTSHRVERGRLEVGAAGGGMIGLSNGLEWDIEALLVADADGTLYLGKDISAGASTRLRKATDDDLKSVLKLVTRYPLEAPPGVSQSSRFSMFGLRRSRRYYGSYGASGMQPVTRFSGSLAEHAIRQLTHLETAGGPLEKKSYLAVLKESPGVELGVENTDEQASLHLLVGYY